MTMKKTYIMLVAVIAASPLFAEIEMGAPFTDGAVLQRGMKVPVWGKVTPPISKMDDGLDPEEKEHHFGIARYDFSPKPSFQAIAVFASLFANKRAVSSYSPAKDAYVLTCGEKCATVTAIWSVAPTKIEIDWFAPRENLVMLDWQGRRLDVPSGEKLCLDACEMPVYFIEK